MQPMSTDRRSRSGRGAGSRQSYSSRRGRDARSKREAGGSSRSSRKRDSRFAEPLFRKSTFRSSYTLPAEQLREEEDAIRSYKGGGKPVCPKCGLPIADVGSALMSREDGQPLHFDCALAVLSEREKLAENERLTYIGQGRFGVITYENPHDIRSFKIQRIIEWEKSDEKVEWRAEFAGLYSQIK